MSFSLGLSTFNTKAVYSLFLSFNISILSILAVSKTQEQQGFYFYINKN